MIVVADTSPINYLVLIEEIAILEELYSQVTIPHAVYAELVHSATPERVRSWIEQPPSWVNVRTPSGKSDGSLDRLNAGEREAIQLAAELHANQLIIDDLEGRAEAQRRGLRVTGTVGVLREAAVLGLLDLRKALKRLQATNFYLAPEVLARILKDIP